MTLVSVSDVEQVAFLARLQLEQAEVGKLAGQLDAIIAYVRQLQSVSTDGVEPTSHVVPLSNVTRPDRLAASLPPDEVATLAPARHRHFIKVPRVLD